MKRSLLLISFLCFSGIIYAQHTPGKTKTVTTQKKTAHKTKRKVKKKKIVQHKVVHLAPDQAKLDSMKRAKTLQKK